MVDGKGPDAVAGVVVDKMGAGLGAQLVCDCADPVWADFGAGPGVGVGPDALDADFGGDVEAFASLGLGRAFRVGVENGLALAKLHDPVEEAVEVDSGQVHRGQEANLAEALLAHDKVGDALQRRGLRLPEHLKWGQRISVADAQAAEDQGGRGCGAQEIGLDRC